MLSAADLSDVTPDPEVADRFAEIQASQAGLLETKIGSSETTLWAGLIGGVAAVTRLIETNSGFGIVTDQYREQAALTFLADGSCRGLEKEIYQKILRILFV